jgi:hypothetical protein
LTPYSASLIAEDTERRDAGAELETRAGGEWAELVGKFELRQVALALDEGKALSGATKEVADELRSTGGYRGCPIPWQALEQRAGETIASGVPNPIRTAPIIDRIFAESVAARMGASFVNVDSGALEYPVTTSAVSAGWAASETGAVAGPTVYATTDRPLVPNHTLGIRMAVTRRALKQSGGGLEAAIRRDMAGAIGEAVDAAVFQGSGNDGEPTGILNLTVSPAIASTAVNAKASYAAFRAAVRRLMDANAAMGPSSARVLMLPLTWSILDDALLTGTAETEWDRMERRFGAGNLVISKNALPAAAAEDGTDKGAHTCLLSAVTGGVAPVFVAAWGAIDLIRDPFSDAASGGLRLTALTNIDVTVSRSQQLQILTGVQDRA